MKLSEAIAILAQDTPSPAVTIIDLITKSDLRGAAKQTTADAAMLGVLCLK